MALALNMMPPELLAALAGRGPASPFGMMPTGKDQSRITGPGQSFADFGLMDDLIAGKPGQQQARLPSMPLDPTDQVGLSAAAQLPPNAMPTQGQLPGGMVPQALSAPPSGGTQAPMVFAPQQGQQQLPTFGMPPAMPQGGQQEGGGFQDWLTGLGRNPTFLAGLTTLGGSGPGAGAAIANAYQRTGGSDDIREYEYAKRQGFNGTFQDWIANKRAGAGEVSLNPVWGEDDQGNPVLGQLNKRGEFVRTKLPEGVKPSRGVEKIDLGTEWGVIDKGGQLIGRYPKDIKGAKRDEALGKVQGETQANLPVDLAVAERTIGEIDQLMNHEGLSSVVGPLDQFRPNWTMSDKGRDALARYNQLKGRSFLQAYMTLKGGGQITEIEGLKAENAMARMDRAQDEATFKEALKDFQDAVRVGVQKLKQKAGQGGEQSSSPTPKLNDPLRIR